MELRRRSRGRGDEVETPGELISISIMHKNVEVDRKRKFYFRPKTETKPKDECPT